MKNWSYYKYLLDFLKIFLAINIKNKMILGFKIVLIIAINNIVILNKILIKFK